MSTTTGTTSMKASRLILLGRAFGLLGMAIVSIILIALVTTFGSLMVIWIGIPITLGLLSVTRGLANRQRLLIGQLTGKPVAYPYREPTETGWVPRLTTALQDPATRRDYLWLWVNATAGITLAIMPIALFFGGLGFMTLATWWWALPAVADVNFIGFLSVHDTASALYFGIPMGLAYLALWWFGTPYLLTAYAALARSFLEPSERDRLARRVKQLSESRADTVDTQAAELRRIERDLHDGAQARLVALGMSLGMAEQLIAKDPKAAQALLAEARSTSHEALSELRDLVRGIHPPVLADRGLDGAVQALALALPLPTEVEIDLPGRAPAPVESAAYFAAAETLANVVKHAGARKAWVRIGYDGTAITMTVGDDGRGGADLAGGTGLRGIERRLAAFDGTLFVTSPVGGPTVIAMELPCELSSPKTSPSSGTV